jgi:CheY-like chemotaxis protein
MTLIDLIQLYGTLRRTSDGYLYQLRRSAALYGQHLNRQASTEDLEDEPVSAWLRDLERTHAQRTAAGHRGNLLVIWRFAARRKLCHPPGEVRRVPRPQPMPEAWTVAEVEALVAAAVTDIEREQTTSVLIIEDEPLIAMQLEDLVTRLGHTVSGTAATRTQARAAVAEAMPGLVLADIQLADGSSGLDAVDDILSVGTMPVIFITAYPERLLTGDRPEPTYLVTKPFQEATVRAAISQALFFGSTRPL